MSLPFWLQIKFEITAFQNDVPRRVPFYVIISWMKYEDNLKLYSFNNNEEYEICFGQKVSIVPMSSHPTFNKTNPSTNLSWASFKYISLYLFLCTSHTTLCFNRNLRQQQFETSKDQHVWKDSLKVLTRSYGKKSRHVLVVQ